MKAVIETLEIDGRPVGVVAVVDGAGMGYALCNYKAGEKFDLGRGIQIAAGRARKHPGYAIGGRLVALEKYALGKPKPDAEWATKAALAFAALLRLADPWQTQVLSSSPPMRPAV